MTCVKPADADWKKKNKKDHRTRFRVLWSFFVNNVLRQIFLNVVNLFQILHAGTKIGQKQIGDRERSHGLHHDNGARYDDRIMASFDLDLDLFACFVYRLLRGLPSLIPPSTPPA